MRTAVMVLALGLVACSGKESDTDDDDTNDSRPHTDDGCDELTFEYDGPSEPVVGDT